MPYLPTSIMTTSAVILLPCRNLPTPDTYSLIGFAEIFDNFKIGTLLDRGYPDYNYPFDMATMADNAPSCSNYINAVKWHVANQKFDAAIFKAGVNNQIVQKYNPAKYPTAKVQKRGSKWRDLDRFGHYHKEDIP